MAPLTPSPPLCSSSAGPSGRFEPSHHRGQPSRSPRRHSPLEARPRGLGPPRSGCGSCRFPYILNFHSSRTFGSSSALRGVPPPRKLAVCLVWWPYNYLHGPQLAELCGGVKGLSPSPFSGGIHQRLARCFRTFYSQPRDRC